MVVDVTSALVVDSPYNHRTPALAQFCASPRLALMASTPELSPPSSANSSDDDYPFFSALSTSAFPFLPNPAYVSLEPPKLMIHSEDLMHENGTHSYTQNAVYPTSPNSCSKDFESCPISQTVSKPLEARTISIQSPTSTAWSHLSPPVPETTTDLEFHNNARRHRKSDPLLHTFDRQFRRPRHPSFVKFPETLPLNKPQLHGLRSPHPRCISNTIGTEALISLAWTGEISSPIVISGYVPSRVGDTYMWPKLKISDAEVTASRRASWPSAGQEDRCGDRPGGQEHHFQPDILSSHHSESRRWTLANAISDDHMTDESLVELLEELRLRRLRSTERSTFRFSLNPSTPTGEAPTHSDSEPDISSPSQTTISDDISKKWITARRMLLVCRELVRTERHYLLSLNVLAKGETQSPPPPLMLSQLPALIHASGILLEAMENNPSVLGVCAAFIQAYEQLEKALVQWCRVVGEFFTTNSDGDSFVVKRSNSAPVDSSPIAGEKGPALLTKRVGSWGRKMHSRTLNIDDITSLVTRNPKSKPHLKPLVRDLAILPTQRITRYVLMFKDLLVHSPPLDIRATIERATEAAQTLAQKADRAQDHAAFRMISPA